MFFVVSVGHPWRWWWVDCCYFDVGVLLCCCLENLVEAGKGLDVFLDHVTADPDLAHHFEDGDDSMLRRAHKAFWAGEFGGPNRSARGSVITLRRPLPPGATVREYDLMIGHLIDALNELGAADDTVVQATAIAAQLRDDAVESTPAPQRARMG